MVLHLLLHCFVKRSRFDPAGITTQFEHIPLAESLRSPIRFVRCCSSVRPVSSTDFIDTTFNCANPSPGMVAITFYGWSADSKRMSPLLTANGPMTMRFRVLETHNILFSKSYHGRIHAARKISPFRYLRSTSACV